MSNEFKHTSVGADLSQAEWEAVTTHIADGQTAGDILYYDGTYWKRRPFNIGADIYHSAAQSIPDSTLTILNFDSELRDTDVIHDNSSNNSRLTCKTAGVYVISTSIAFGANTTGRRQVKILLNGTTTLATDKRNAIAAAVACDVGLSTIYALAVNDYVEVQVYQTSGGSLDVGIVGYFNSRFMMQRIG